VKGELFNSGLNSVEVATHVQPAVATTTSPTKGNAGSSVFLIDANSVASAVTAIFSITSYTLCSEKTSKF
jgi:hypothetical protein